MVKVLQSLLVERVRPAADMPDAFGPGAAFADAALTPEQNAEAGKRLKTVNEDIERLEGRWLELSTRIDELGADR